MAPITPPKTPPIIAPLLVFEPEFELPPAPVFVDAGPVVVADAEEELLELLEELLTLDDEDDSSTPGSSMKPRHEDCLCVFVYTGGSDCGFKRMTN